MQVDFYLLCEIPVERVLPRLAEKTLAAGRRLLMVAEPEGFLAMLDETLWTCEPTSFLPHSRDGGEHDENQPILLSASLAPSNAATFLAIADGRWRDDALGFERILYLFGRDRKDDARAVWRALGDRGDVEIRFWKQDEAGKWRQGP